MRAHAEVLKGVSSTLANTDQLEVLGNFRKGTTNVLFCTSVAEEGLDVQHCSLVICFDVPVRPLSKVQTVGRARAEKAEVVFLRATDPITGDAGSVRSDNRHSRHRDTRG